MKSQVILFCVLLFCSKIVDSISHSEDPLRQRVNPPSKWQVDQNTQYTDFTQTRNVNPNPAIQQESTQDFYSNPVRYNYDGYGYNKSPVGSLLGEQLLGSYNSQVDGRRLESYPPRVESYPSQVGFDSQQLRNPNWRSQNQYINSAPSGSITDSDRPLMTTVQEPYRGPVQYSQPKYASSSNRRFFPDRHGKYVTNSGHRFGSISPVPYEDYSEGQAVASEIKARLTGDQRYLQTLASQSGNTYNEVPAVISDTMAEQSENIKYLENYRSTSNLINIAPSTNYDDGSPVISEVENYSLDSRSSNAPVSYESYNNGQAAASDIKARLTGGRRNTQDFVPHSGIIYKESPAVISTDTLEDQRIDRSRSDFSNTAIIINYDDDSPATSSAENYSSGSIPSNVRVPYEINSEAQTAAFELKPRPTSGRKYIQTIAPQSKIMSDNVPAIIATDILAEQSRTVKNEKSQNYKSISDSSNIASVTNQEGSYPVISAADNTETVSKPSNPTPENIENKAPVSISKLLSDKLLARRYAHNYRSESGLSNIARDDSYNGAPTVISETAEEKSGSYEVNYGPKEPIPINTNSGTSSASTDTENDVPPNGSSSSIPSNTNQNHKSYSGITELSLANLLSKTDIDKFMARNTKRFLVIHPNKTIEYLDNIDTDSHQNSKLRLVNTQPKNVGASEGDGTQLPENVKDNPVDETVSNLPIEDLPAKHSSLKPLRPHAKQQTGSGSLKPLLRPNIRHPVHHHKTVHVYQPADDNNSNPSFPDGNQLTVEKNFKSQLSNANQPGDENNSNSSSPDESQPSNENNAKTLSSNENQSGDDNGFIPLIHESQPGDDNDYKPVHTHKIQLNRRYESKTANLNYPGDVNNASSMSPRENKPADDNDSKALPSNDDKPSYLYKIQRAVGNQSLFEKKSTPHSSNENQSGDDIESNPSSPDENQPSYKPVDDKDYNSLPSNENLPGDDNDTKLSRVNQQTGDNNSKSSSPDENQPEDKNNFESLISNENQSRDDADSKPSYLDDDQPGNDKISKNLPTDENQSEGDTDSEPLRSKKGHRVYRKKSKPSRTKSSTENKPGDDNILNSSSPDENKPEDNTESTPFRSFKKQLTDDSTPTSPVVSKTDENLDSTTAFSTTPNYTTSTKPQVPNKHKHRHNRRKSTTSSPIVSSTTPRSEETSEDQIITISPMEQVTDNVSDVPPVTTSTTTAKPVKTVAKSDTIKDNNDNQDDNSAHSSSEDLDSNSDMVQMSTTTASPISSTTLTDNTSGDKITKKSVENNKKQTNDKTVESPDTRSKEKNDIQRVQSAVYNSSELLDTSTDVPAESDVYSPVTTSPSVQNDVNTGDASGDNTLELNQPETDITITVSSNTDNDSEDDVITINVEVSESAGSSVNDKSLLISIDTDDDSDDDSKTSLASGIGGQSTDCKKDHTDDDGRGKNLEIDMSNIQGEPTMWIKTTNQDFIEKLTNKNDTAFDVVYFFNMVTQPVIEREKETTFYCNGTVVITTKETTYPNKDDPTPNVEKRTQTMQIKDYKRNDLE